MDPGEGGGNVAVDLMFIPGGGGPTGDPKLFGFIVSENVKRNLRNLELAQLVILHSFCTFGILKH